MLYSPLEDLEWMPFFDVNVFNYQQILLLEVNVKDVMFNVAISKCLLKLVNCLIGL